LVYFLEAKPASEIAHGSHAKRGDSASVPLPGGGAGSRINSGGLRMANPRRDSRSFGRAQASPVISSRYCTSYDRRFGQRFAIKEQDIVTVMPPPGDPQPPGKPALAQARWSRALIGDPVLLFRYSALIFNAHRIHYDLPYVTEEEHYPGLIVHGPLQATLLMELCRHNSQRPMKQFDYRALSPVFHTETFTVNGNPSADGSSAEVWTANGQGITAMAGGYVPINIEPKMGLPPCQAATFLPACGEG
jgi:3-methylfumaryl-CoA hydratase